MWPHGTATNWRLLAVIGVLRLLAALVAQDDKHKGLNFRSCASALPRFRASVFAFCPNAKSPAPGPFRPGRRARFSYDDLLGLFTCGSPLAARPAGEPRPYAQPSLFLGSPSVMWGTQGCGGNPRPEPEVRFALTAGMAKAPVPRSGTT